MKMKFKTIADLNHLITYGLYRIPKDIDLVVGIPRSGMLVASMISLYMNLPLTDLDSFLTGHIYHCGNTKRKTSWIFDVTKVNKILLVDDTSFSGVAAKEALDKIANAFSSISVCFLICYVTPQTKDIPDIYLEELSSPRAFEWNYLHQANSGYFCFDLDGVLCLNPTKEQDDDGFNYLDFIRNASLRVAPTRRIGHIVTCRLEKYRPETEKWLLDNGIEYKELIMMDYETAQERTLANEDGNFKGRVYKSIEDSWLFIESDPTQAEIIASTSQKLVFCTSNHKVYGNIDNE